MKLRFSFVSNSSSSSFLVPKKPDYVESIKLPEEIWKRIEKNFTTYEGKKYNLSEESNEWWLTELISDCVDKYSDIADMEHAHHYLDGHEEPYGYYDCEDDYIVFKGGYETDFYVQASDMSSAMEGIPEVIKLREEVNGILKSKLNKSQKLAAIASMFKF